MDQAENLRKRVKKEKRQRKIAKTITITSGKGGVGKTSIAVNLALALHRKGIKVIILDGDFGLSNIEIMLGIRPKYNLADLMFRGKDLTDIITEGPEGIGFISGGSGIQELANLSRDQILYLISKLIELDEIADVIIIDTGAGINDTVMEFVAASSELLLIATPEPTSITDSYALLKALNRRKDYDIDGPVIKMIANQVRSYEEGEELYEKLSIVVNKFLDIQLNFLGAIPKDENVSKAVMSQKPAITQYPNSSFIKEIQGFAGQLYNKENAVETNDKKGIAQLFTYLLGSRIKKS